MRREANDRIAQALAKSAGLTRDIVALCGGADHDLAPFGRHSVSGLVGWQYRHNGRNTKRRQLVSMTQIVGAKIDRKPRLVGVGDDLAVRRAIRAKNIVVRIGEALAARVSGDKRGNISGNNLRPVARQIARLVMTPQGASRKRGNLSAKL